MTLSSSVADSHGRTTQASGQRTSAQRPPFSAYQMWAAFVVLVCMVLVWRWASIAQDAFIAFRYAEQLHLGNGLVFNAGERVQGFTCALWTLLLCLAPMQFTLIWALAMGFLATLGMLLILAALMRTQPRAGLGLAAAAIMLFSSLSLLEWSTAGMENSLNHFLLALTYAAALWPHASVRTRRWVVAFGTGLLMLNRLDQVLLVFPLLLHFVWIDYRQGRLRASIGIFIVGLAPVLIWMLFAAVYYGFPLPNTSLAKLGVAAHNRIGSGVLCLLDYARSEPWHISLIIAAPLVVFLRPPSDVPALAILRCASISVVIQLIYFVYVGGDYMRGRFLTGALFLAALTVAWILASQTRKRSAQQSALVFGALLLLPFGLAQTAGESKFDSVSGVVRLRDVYMPLEKVPAWWRSSLSESLHKNDGILSRVSNFNQRLGADVIIGFSNLGESTYGIPEVTLIDYYGLCDPFTARSRASQRNRPGHVQRNVPIAYLQARGCVNVQRDWENRLLRLDPSLVEEVNAARRHPQWDDPHQEQVYRELEILTRGPLFTRERFGLILKYAFTRPLAYDSSSPAPAIGPRETAGLLELSAPLAPRVSVAGIEPSQNDFVDPKFSKFFWMGPRHDGRVSVVLNCLQPTRVLFGFPLLKVGPGVDHPESCKLQLLLNSTLVQELPVSAPRFFVVPLDLPAGRSSVDLMIPQDPGPGRYFMDPRPLMLTLGPLHLWDSSEQQAVIDRRGLTPLDAATLATPATVWVANADVSPPDGFVRVSSAELKIASFRPSLIAGNVEVFNGTQNIWLGPIDQGRIAFVLESNSALPAALEFNVLQLGISLPNPASAPLEVWLDNSKIADLTVKASDRPRVSLPLKVGTNVVTLRIPQAAGPGRYGPDPRPLMVYLTGFEFRAAK